jgi:hypothetical protein
MDRERPSIAQAPPGHVLRQQALKWAQHREPLRKGKNFAALDQR